MKVAYRYDENTKELKEALTIYRDPVASEKAGEDVYRFPEMTTEIKPFENREGLVQVFTGNGWKYVEDHRGKIVWKTYDESMTISEIGPIPVGYSEDRPHAPITKEELFERTFQMKCDKAYNGIIISMNGNDYYAETNKESIAMWTSKFSTMSLLSDKDLIHWKVWTANREPTIASFTKDQFIKVFAFGMNMINQAFGVEGLANDEISKMTDTQLQELIDEAKMNAFVKKIEDKFNKIKISIKI